MYVNALKRTLTVTYIDTNLYQALKDNGKVIKNGNLKKGVKFLHR